MKWNIVRIAKSIVILTYAFFLLPFFVKGQDLSEAQKKERCQNNKNRITELEVQLRITDEELSQSMEAKEMETARSRMLEVKNFKNLAYKDKNSANWNDRLIRVGRIAAQYDFELEDCIEEAKLYSTSPRGVCFAALEIKIAKKINKAVTLNRPALLAKKKEIETQLSAHRNKLIELGCDQSSGTQAIWSGTFTNSLMKLTLSGNAGAVTATYSWGPADNASKGNGTWTLKPDGNTTAKGTWTESFEDNDKTSQRSGSITVILNGNSLTYNLIEDEPKHSWKPGKEPYPSKMRKDAPWSGTLTR